MTDGPRFDHLVRLTDRFGTFEHAEHATPRREHGYCVDDVARVLVVSAREPRSERRRSGPWPRVRWRSSATRWDPTATVAIVGRPTERGPAKDRPRTVGARSLWGLGTAAASTQFAIAGPALCALRTRRPTTFPVPAGHGVRRTWCRGGARGSIRRTPRARSLLSDFADASLVARDDPAWPWPEVRLYYANALLPDAMIAAGVALERPELVAQGLDLLGWLLARETRDGHLSVTPAEGSGPGDAGPGFDQQPIEVSTMADACARALSVDDSPKWLEGIRMANAWFDGDNDAKVDDVGSRDGWGLRRPARRGRQSESRGGINFGAGINPSAGLRAPNYLYMKENALASRTDVQIVPDSSRVVALLFVAGQEMGGAESRASNVVETNRGVARSRRAPATEGRHPAIRAPAPRHRGGIQSTRRTGEQPVGPERGPQRGTMAPARRVVHPRVFDRGRRGLQSQHGRAPRSDRRARRRAAIRDEFSRGRRRTSIEHRFSHRSRHVRRRDHPGRARDRIR